MKSRFWKSLFLPVIVASVFNHTCLAQGGFYYGPSDVVVGQEEYYAAGSGTNIYWSVTPSSMGTVTVQSNPSAAKILWNTVGSARIDVDYYVNGQYYYASMNVTVHPALSGGTIALEAPSVIYNSTAPLVQNVSGASGGLGLTDYSYQWQRSYDNLNWEDVQTISPLFCRDYEPVKQTTYYRREAYAYDVAYSNTVVLNVIPALQGGRIASPQIVTPGATPAALTSISGASGGSGGYTYGWEYSNDNITWNALVASGTSYQPGSLTKTTRYRRKVNSGEQTRYSNMVQIVVKNNVSYNIPATTTVTPTEPKQAMQSLTGTDQNALNSVMVSTVLKPDIKDNTGLTALSLPTDIQNVTSYQDGLGRSIQTVLAKASPQQKDIISINQYDGFGRQMLQFLPYVANTDASNTGKFRTDAATAQPSFYNSLYTGSNADDYFYTKTATEDAPLSRIQKSTLPGKSYTGKSIGAQTEERVNYAYENVRIWNIGDNETELPESAGVYADGVLAVSVYTDEKQHKVTEYRDLEGKTVMRAVQSTDAAADGIGLRTYYVYDEMRNLRYVIPPLAEKYCAINNAWSSLPQSIADQLCFSFFYDGNDRIVWRRLPGQKGSVEYVYDMRNRPVFMRDPLLKDQGKWMVYFYDGLDRPVMTAIYTNATATRQTLQAQLDQAAASYVTITHTAPPPADLYVAERVPGTTAYTSTHSITFNPGFTSESNASFTASINPAASGTTESIKVFNPLPGISGYEPVTFTYYDNYSWQGAAAFNNNYTLDAGGNPYPDPVQPNLLADGKITGFKVKMTGSDQWLTSTLFYDDKGREIQLQEENISGSTDITTSQYDFSGTLLSTYLLHRNAKSGTTPSTKILLRYQYDGSGKSVAGIYQKILSEANPVEKQLSAYTYDPLGRLQTVTIAPGGAGPGLETLHYTYNLQGQLTGINPEYVDNKLSGNYFGEKLFYDRGFSQISLDGNLAGISWRRKGNADEEHAYGYAYDPVGRLSRADYSQLAGSVWGNANSDYGVKIPGYDENGNIKSLKREGMLPGNVKTTIDELTYTYDHGGYSNNLLNVKDDKGNQKVGDFNDGNITTGINDYVYDKNGNLVHDRNRGISITYDPVLDKPLKISLDSDPTHKYIQYIYSYDGTLLQKLVKNLNTSNTYTYINGFTYKNDTLQYFLQPQGRVRYTKEQNANGDYTGKYAFVYDYFISDHLGNVRAVLTEQQLVNKYPAATLEDSRIASEKNYYDIEDSRRVVKNLTGATQSSFENKLYRTNAGNNEKTGLGITLKVMAGDQVYIKAESFYTLPGGSGVGNPLPIILTELANAFIGTPVIASSGKGITAGTLTGDAASANSMSDFLNNNRNPPNAQTPRAYLNWVLFDDQFRFVAGGADPVNPNGGYKLHDAFINSPVQVTKSGYLFVYCSNESNINVFFDNLQLTHVQGHLQQEDTYYPYGMGIAALSSKAANGLQNGYKYNGISEEDNFDLDLYDTYYRTLDPQLGRWWQMDPYNQFASPYLSMGNNPVNYTDPGGGFLFDSWGQFLSSSVGFFGGAAAGYFIAKNNGGNPGTGALFGAIGGGAAGYFGYGLAAGVNWGNIAGTLGNAGSWAGNLLSFNSSSFGWYLNNTLETIEWLKNVKSAQYKFISKEDLTFAFSSYIDRASWYAEGLGGGWFQHGNPRVGLDISGEKLYSEVNLDFTVSKRGKLTGLNINMSNKIMATSGIFQGVLYSGLPNVELGKGNQNPHNFAVALEKHTKVDGFETFGLFVNGYLPVNVAQSLFLRGEGNKIHILAGTDIFPSARLSVFPTDFSRPGIKLFQYNQPSFRKTHSWFSKPEPSLYKRFSSF